MSRRQFSLKVMTLFVLGISVGLAVWELFVRRPKDQPRFRRIAYYLRRAGEFRSLADRIGREELRRELIGFAVWFEERARVLSASETFDPAIERGILNAQLSANGRLGFWEEYIGKAY